MLTISQPPLPVKEERKATLTVTMTRLLERFKVLDRSIMCKANEMVPSLVSIILFGKYNIVGRGDSSGDFNLLGTRALTYNYFETNNKLNNYLKTIKKKKTKIFGNLWLHLMAFETDQRRGFGLTLFFFIYFISG